MKRFILIALLLTMPACAGNSQPQLTPAGQHAYTADQVVIRVNELQNAAISANTNGGLPEAQTRVIVKFAVSADKILATAPQGWQVQVLALWTEAKKQIPSVQSPAVAAAMAAVDVALGVIQ